MKNGFFIIALETFLGHLDGCSKLIIYLGCRVAAIQCHGDVRFHSVFLLGKVLMSRVCDNVHVMMWVELFHKWDWMGQASYGMIDDSTLCEDFEKSKREKTCFRKQEIAPHHPGASGNISRTNLKNQIFMIILMILR